MVYRVNVASLPPELQRQWRVTQGVEIEPHGTLPVPTAADTALGLALWRHAVIRPILDTDPGTRERAEVIRKVVARTHDGPDGAPCRVAERTLREWIARYEHNGFGGLLYRARSDRGGRRVLVSRDWDAFMVSLGMSKAEREEQAEAIIRHVRSLWRMGTPSAPMVRLNAIAYLMERAREAGSRMANDELRALCQLPATLIDRERRYGQLATRKRDGRQWAAKHQPRIRRVRDNLRPMEYVAGDVRHLDIVFKRPDGTLCTPKCIAFLDLATNRFYWKIVVLPKGRMVRGEDVIAAFLDMCADPSWGAPGRLYLDRGGEYNWAAPVMADLAHLVDLRDADELENDAGLQRARAYNPQGKVIEGLFSAFARCVESQLDGYIGGRREAKKTEHQGRPPAPITDDEDALQAALATALAYYHNKPMRGHLAGKSPNEAFRASVEQGWQPTILDPAHAEAAFAKESDRKVFAGGMMQIGGRHYRSDDLLDWVGEKVTVRVPRFGERRLVWVYDEQRFLCIAAEATEFDFYDRGGATEQARQERVLNDKLADMRADTDRLDPMRVMEEVVAAHPPPPTPDSAGVITISPELRKASQAARRETAAPNRDDATGGVHMRRKIEMQNLLLKRAAGDD